VIGERVRLARESCRLTQAALAELAGVSQGTLSDLEAGRILSPAEDMVKRVASATQFPVAFFHLGPLPDLPEGSYRRLKRASSKVGKQVRAQVRQVVELVERSEEQRLRLPHVALQPVETLADIDEIEEVAQEVRRSLGVGSRDPIPNLTRAVERAGVVVVWLPTEMEDHDGYSVWPDFGLGGRPVIAVSRGSGDRDRFTIAHELGHLVLHSRRDPRTPNAAEREAHRFAGALLLPKEAALEAIRPPVTLRVLMGVKATFGSSIAMNAQRALDLQLIDRDHFVSLRKQLSKRGWTRSEPVEVAPEKAVLIAKVLDLMGGEGSLVQRAERVSMPPLTFRSLAG
jgi:Zn-dependent peptidase ImmA (M78 family)/DNA-binding transcriptional regulator YdaS (Cro superfamily)